MATEQGAQFRRGERAAAKAAADAAKAAADAKQGRSMMRRRQRWEKANPARMKTAGAEHGLAPGQMYEARGWSETSSGPMMGERQLPGLEDPSSAAQPTRWEELHPEQQAKAQAGLKTVAGSTIDSMTRAFGAQLDQSYERSSKHAPKGKPGVPFSRDFYSEGEPARVMQESAKKLNVPVGVHAAINAFTSPNTKFKQGERYPNLETAEAVVRQHQAGIPTSEVTTGRREADPRDWDRALSKPMSPPKKNQGYHSNARKSARALDLHDAGVPLRDWRNAPSKSSPEGSPMFGPKIGPYHNSWLKSTPDFFVSDVHSGGGGMVPHLSTDKPILRDAAGATKLDKKGKPQRDDSEREKAISDVPHFHAMADHAACKAMEARGLTKVRQAQASQWGEEQIQRTEKDPQRAMATETKEYPNVGNQFRQLPGQQKLL